MQKQRIKSPCDNRDSYLPPVQNFSVTLDVGAGAAPANAFNLHIFLEGELLREIQ